MPLLLSDDDVEAVLTMDQCLDAMESACKQEGLGRAANRTKSTIYSYPSAGGVMQYVSMEGAISAPPVLALRLGFRGPGGPEAANAMMVFRGDTGELLALVKHGLISSYRTAAVAGLAAREMARSDAAVVGILGSGGMAHAHALAYAAVRKIERFKVYSPNAVHSKAFGDWLAEATGARVDVLESEEPVVRDSDIVAACTNVRGPIVESDWVDQPGLHFTGVQLGEQPELEPAGLAHFDRLVTYLSGASTHHNTDPERSPGRSATDEESLATFSDIPRQHTLADVLLGRAPGRASARERNYFFSEGTGVQFAAVGWLVYHEAHARGVGQEMPVEWAQWFARGPLPRTNP